MNPSIPSSLLSIARDPIDLTPLKQQNDCLVNPATNRRYRIIDSIPVLLDHTDLGPQNLKAQHMYRWMAGGFDVVDRIGNLVTRNAIIKLRRMLAERLAIKPGDRCLYTSIGTGLDLPYLAERLPLHEFELVGLDLSMEMLRRCQKKLAGRETTSMLVQGNAERLPFADGVFDVVFHVGGVNLFDRPAQAVKEMARVARPGALVVYADESREVIRNQYQGWNLFTRRACKGFSTDFDPRSWAPPGIAHIYETVWNGKGYFVSFRTAS